MSEEWVKVADAANEPEAAVIAGHLESEGIEATYDSRNEGLGGMFGQSELGPQEILVRAADLERAKQVLAERGI